MKRNAPSEIAGLPFIAKVSLSDEDLKTIKKYIGNRRNKIKTGRIYLFLIGILLTIAIWLGVSDNAQAGLIIVGSSFLFFSAISCLGLIDLYNRELKLLEADLECAYLWRFEGVITNFEHFLVKSELLQKDRTRVQKVEVLPASGKVHRINNSILWSWRRGREPT